MSIYRFAKAYSPCRGSTTPRIAFLGDSITHGKQTLPDASYVQLGGWRARVYSKLVAAGITPTMLGPVDDRTDSLADGVAGRWHAGYDGSSAANWLSNVFGIVQTAINGQGAPPDIVCLALGTNGNNTQAEGQAVGQVADLVVAAWPGASILLLTRAPVLNSSTGAINVNCDVINAQIQVEAARLGRHATCVHATDPVLADERLSIVGYDGIHPTAASYVAMGDVVFDAIMGLLT